jgi:hypothetical protein
MRSVCIYCGGDKLKALDECSECKSVPESHPDVIHSIILSHSADEPYLNFIALDDIEAFREAIISGLPLHIDPRIFREAEEAYRAAGTMGSPQALKYFAGISHPVLVVTLFVFIAFVLLGA